MTFHFNTLTAEDLGRICRKEILAQPKPFYDGWIIKALLKRSFTRPAGVTQNLKSSVADHLDKLNAYIASLTDLSKDVAKYSRFYFDAKVKDLVGRTNDILKVDYVNPYDSRENLNKLTAELGPHAEEVIVTFADADVQRPEIESIGAVFRAEDLDQSLPVDDPKLLEKVNENKADIIKSLYQIIRVFTKTDQGQVHDDLTTEQKNFLQVYFNTFKYLLPPFDHHKAVIEALTSQEFNHPGPHHTFVNEDLFTYMEGLNTVYNPIFVRDHFITKFNPEYTLTQLHDAATPALYSWDILKAFDGVDYAKAADNADQSEEAKKERKIARLHAMLYKVYTIARDDDTLPLGHDTNNQAILRKLYTWVLKTDQFDDPIIELDGMVDAGKKMHNLLPRETFKRYFLPLLDLICKKIDGCDILKSDKPAVVDKFVKYGNHDDLTKDKITKQIITPALMDAVTENAAVKELEDFGNKLEAVLGDALFDEPITEEEEFPQDFQQLDDKDPKKNKKNDAPVLIRKKLKPAPLASQIPELQRKDSAKEIPKVKLTPEAIQENFDNTIGKRFIPDVTLPEEDAKKEAQLDAFISSIDAIENIPKKRQISRLLMNFIIKSRKPTLVKKMVDHKMAKIRSPIDFEQSKGFRNFLFRTMSDVGRYAPASADDEYNYGVDVFLYIHAAGMDHLKQLASEKGPKDEATVAVAKKVSENLKTLQAKFLTGNTLEKRKLILGGKFDENFLQRSSGVEFFHNFLDFFSYYENIPTEAAAANVDYYRVYLQFYQILAHMRRGEVQAYENPHAFVLGKIQECMMLTEEQQSFVVLKDIKSRCVFSYRKYAEVYFFYKMYLFATKKNVRADLDMFQKGDKFDVHTRMFLVFSSMNPVYSDLLNNNCNSGLDRSICHSWNLYNAVLRYMRSPDTLQADFDAKIDTFVAQNANQRINAFNGLEAAFYHNRRANMIEWSRVLRLFDVEGVDTNTGLGKLLKFTSDDEGALTRYLIRSFKKLTIEPHELKISTFVNEVLQTRETGDHDTDALVKFLFFNDRVAPFYIKLFLQFATTDAQFARLARVLIDNGITSNLISINDVEKDAFFRTLAMVSAEKEQKDVPEYIYRALQEEYTKVLKQCKAAAVDNILDFVDPELLELLGGSSLGDQIPTTAAVDVEEEIILITEELKTVEIKYDIKKGDTIESLLAAHETQLRKNLGLGSNDLVDVEYTLQEREEEIYEDEYEEESGEHVMDSLFAVQRTQEIAEELGERLQRKTSEVLENPSPSRHSPRGRSRSPSITRRSSINTPSSVHHLRDNNLRYQLRNRIREMENQRNNKPARFQRSQARAHKKAGAIAQKISDTKSKTHHLVV